MTEGKRRRAARLTSRGGETQRLRLEAEVRTTGPSAGFKEARSLPRAPTQTYRRLRGKVQSEKGGEGLTEQKVKKALNIQIKVLPSVKQE